MRWVVYRVLVDDAGEIRLFVVEEVSDESAARWSTVVADAKMYPDDASAAAAALRLDGAVMRWT